MEDNDKDLNELINNKSFKIKPIYLELKNYSYFHSAISNDNDDYNDRFVGRTKLIKKIKSFILESSKNTGTYLISGFRGMGKTSLVNKALSSLEYDSKLIRFIMLWLLLLPLVFIKEDYLKRDLYFKNFFPTLLSVLSIMVLVFHWYFSLNIKTLPIEYSLKGFWRYFSFSYNKKNLKRDKFTVYNNLLSVFVYILMVAVILYYFTENYSNDKIKIYKFRSIYDKFWFITSIIVFLIGIDFFIKELLKSNIFWNDKVELCKIKIKFWNNWNKIFINILKSILFIVVFCLVCIFIYNVETVTLWVYLVTLLVLLGLTVLLKYQNIKEDNRKYKTVFSELFTFINLKQYLIVNINLSKDKLTEKDVLKYITNELLNEYKKWYFNLKNIKRLLGILTLTFFIFFTINVVYDLFSSNAIFEKTNKDFELSKYFPSQIFLEDGNYKLNINDYSNVLKNLNSSNKCNF